MKLTLRKLYLNGQDLSSKEKKTNIYNFIMNKVDRMTSMEVLTITNILLICKAELLGQIKDREVVHTLFITQKPSSIKPEPGQRDPRW